MVERELDVNPHDFRRWVCLHEETHRTQFTSVPWLRPYVQEQMSDFLLASDLDPASILDRLRAAADAVAGAVRGGEGESLIEAIQSPRQREILDQMTSVMTLVEGHGDYVMDAVGPAVVPSVAEIRAKFSARRGSAGRIEQAIRRVLGIDLKMKQYEQGSQFVKAVVEEAGMATFNKVWTSPETLPTKDELANPQSVAGRVDRGSLPPAPQTERSGGPAPGSRGHPACRPGRPGRARLRGPCRWGPCRWGPGPGWPVLVACSGGADSLALAAALAFEAPGPGCRPAASPSITACSRARPSRPPGSSRFLSGLGLDPVLSPSR